MGKKVRGSALRAKKRAKEAQLELEATVAHGVETAHVTSKPNQELFVLDTTAAAVPRQERVRATTKKPSIGNRPRVVDEKVRALLEKHDAPTLQKMAASAKAKNRRHKKRKKAAFDLWDDTELTTETTTTATALQPPERRMIAGIAPPRVHTKAAPLANSGRVANKAGSDLKAAAAAAVAVDVAQSGQSYHPDPQHHQNVIGEALALELRRKEAEEYKETPIASGMSDETKALLVGDSDDDDYSSSNDDDDDDDNNETIVLHKQKQKLTRAQRNRQKRIKAQEKELNDRKVAKKRLNAIAEAKTLSKQLAKKEALQKERKALVAALKKQQTRTLGTCVWQQLSETNPIHAPALPVALTDDLSGALRTIKPKGSLLTDRMESFKDRNMAAKKHVGDKKTIVQGNKRRKLKVKAKGHDIHVKDERGHDYLLMG